MTCLGQLTTEFETDVATAENDDAFFDITLSPAVVAHQRSFRSAMNWWTAARSSSENAVRPSSAC
ncbi:hypothetical protein [Haloprofundus marisrubri]|uniref:hypothetical protein n=1 Tax=Haloprofundus marisrubri TaxID=1514971 RepID=UPI00373FD07E